MTSAIKATFLLGDSVLEGVAKSIIALWLSPPGIMDILCSDNPYAFTSSEPVFK